LTRRQLLKGAAGIGAGVGFIGNWRWARAQAKKPILIGLTCDATGTFADSGQADRCGMVLAIEERLSFPPHLSKHHNEVAATHPRPAGLLG
jgi:branched-chain amino acid transport system substrate-binding protein